MPIPYEFPERTVGTLDCLSVMYEGERFYVVNQYDNGNLALRKVCDGYRKGVQRVVKPSEVKPLHCSHGEDSSEVSKEIRLLWAKLNQKPIS